MKKNKQEKRIEEKRKEYEDFMDEQFRILRGHFDRCMLRCHNKLVGLDLK